MISILKINNNKKTYLARLHARSQTTIGIKNLFKENSMLIILLNLLIQEKNSKKK